jgi:hypothetical protein
MKDTTNLNDVRRLRQFHALGKSVAEASARLHIQPSVVTRWFETFAAEHQNAPGDPSLEVEARARGRRKIT